MSNDSDKIQGPLNLVMTPAAKDRAIDVLTSTGNPSKAAEAVGCGRRTLYEHRRMDPLFDEAWEEAIERFRDNLEQVALDRAVEGWEEPVFYRGVEVGSIRKYDHTLLAMRLKAERPDKYAERKKASVDVRHTGVLVVEADLPGDEADPEEWADAVNAELVEDAPAREADPEDGDA